MNVDSNEIYRITYYGYIQDGVPVPEGGGGGTQDGVSREEMEQAINDALGTIHVNQYDDDTTEITVNGESAGTIDDVYLTGVDRDDETNEILFNLNNGKDPIRVDADLLDNPNIDGSTF